MECCSETAPADVRKTVPETLKLEFLFLDENVCNPCRGTGKVLDEVVEIVAAPLAVLGLTLSVERIRIATREDAIRQQLITSPTIRINGQDIDPDPTQGECSSCGEIAGGQTTVDCRTWRWKGETFSTAPAGKIVEAVMAAAVAETIETFHYCPAPAAGEAFVLPENLEGFFWARQNGERRCC